MKKFEDLEYREQKEVAKIFGNWLRVYTHEVIVKVLEKRDEILNNEFAMGLLKELQKRDEAEYKDFNNTIEFMMKDFDAFSKYNPHNHAVTHASSYRDVLYDMFIRDI